MRTFEPMERVETPDGDGKVVRVMAAGMIVVRLDDGGEAAYDPGECFTALAYMPKLGDFGNVCGCCKKGRDLVASVSDYGEVCGECCDFLARPVAGVDPVLFEQGMEVHRRHM